MTRRVEPKKEKAAVKKEAVKKEKGKGKARQEPEEDDDEMTMTTTVSTSRTLPISPSPKQITPGSRASVKDWQNVEEVMHQPSGIIANVAASMAEASGRRGATELDRVMKGLIDVQSLMTGHSKVLSDIIQSIAMGDEITDPNARYLSLIDDMNAGLRPKDHAPEIYEERSICVFQEETIYEVENPGSAMPPITDFIPREEGDESDDDDDIIMGGGNPGIQVPAVDDNPQGPYDIASLLFSFLRSRLNLLLSLRSICNHSFSGEAVREFFKNKRGPQKCPASGCSKSFTLAQCQPNPDLARKIKAIQKRQARAQQQEDSDAEEVID
ncbi:SP-RING-type domain-containing protein [Mycena venus]|uniref:SP-RING-type domain-containing protein n=1 Tax=Mycena venus TaxID=2733690 RepID=A0A8H7D8J3_9AGAR|nr:SP-RING-type domain-containing protein [Mycena venus]